MSAAPARAEAATPRLETAHGPLEARVLRDAGRGEPCVALSRGEIAGSSPLTARVDSSCITSESFDACACDCAEQLDAALAEIAREPHAWNRHHLASESRSGHRLAARPGPQAELPAPVEPFEPRTAAGAPSWRELAAYLLPVARDDAAWRAARDARGERDAAWLASGLARLGVPCAAPQSLEPEP